jgi:hypothetical protein
MSGDVEAENRLLRILAEGCRAHPAYRARRRPGVADCETCARMWSARRALYAPRRADRGRAA